MTGPHLNFTFDGKAYVAQPGDTLAAALVRNGVKLVGRSFKYHRPRGIMAAGVEEPNALVTVGEGGRAEPNTRATDVFVYEGLVARSQNRWPSLSFDVGAGLGLFSKALPAGFYYKTFFGRARLWLVYEWFIRKAAGLGNAPTAADPDRFSQRSAFCDVLVAGGGPAGLQAALDAVEAGKRVMLVEQDAVLGASLLRDPGQTAPDWAEQTAARIRAGGGRILTRTTAQGYWEHGLVTLVERLVEPGQKPANGLAQRLWHVRAAEVVVATGAIERTVAFANNDLPGVLLSQAVRTYARRFGASPGRRAVIVANNDDAYLTVQALRAAGAQVVAILDSRPAPAGADLSVGFAHFNNAVPVSAQGGANGVRALTAKVDGRARRFEADLIAVSGGFTPTVHLHMQAGGSLDWHEDAQAFVPTSCPRPVNTVGAALSAGPRTSRPQTADDNNDPKKSGRDVRAPVDSLLSSPAGDPHKSFVDFQNDVSLADIDLAWQEGYRSVEHLKRYTTLGMATDQGKTSNMAALARLAQRQGVSIPEAGVTTFRPPFTPVTMGLLAGRPARDAGAHTRRIALHAVHAEKNPVWQPIGVYWKRPRAYPQGGESIAAASKREAVAVRTAVGLSDVSTLAKFMITGPDAAIFLERVCATTVGRLAPGRGRYTFMLREDGFVFDDGTVWNLDGRRWFLTSSTGGADRMAAHLSFVRQVLYPELRVSVVNVQEHYAGIAIAGPQSSATVAALTGVAAPRHMSYVEATVAGVPVLLFAASYSGERAFEIHVDASQAEPVWRACEAEAAAGGGCVYGLEAMEILRIEKGHLVVGGEVDGRLTPYELGLDRMLNKKGGYIGEAGLARPALSAPGRMQLVGLESLDSPIPEGGMLMAGGAAQGHVTGSAYRAVEGGAIALAHLRDGFSRHGEILIASSPTRGEQAQVKVVAPHFYDAEGARYRD